MSDKIVVPEGMLKAANERAGTCKCLHCEQNRDAVLEAALRWLDGELDKLLTNDPESNYDSAIEGVRFIFKP